MSDAPEPRGRRRVRWAVALLVLGLVVALVPGLGSGDHFLPSVFTDVQWDSAVPSVGGATFTLAGLNHFGFRIESSASLAFDTFPADPSTSFAGLVTTDLAWSVAAATLLVAPLLFVWWRRSAAGFVRIAGIAACVAATGAVCALVLTRRDREYLDLYSAWITVPAGAALMAAAFLVAPAPRVRDE